MLLVLLKVQLSAATSVPLVGVEGTFNNSNTLIREGQSGGTAIFGSTI